MLDWKDILAFWFGDLDGDGMPDPAYRRRWFQADRAFDQEIRRRFLSLVLFASEGGLEHWRTDSGGALAEIILLDQFSRNIYRGSSLAFEQDQLARHLCRQAMNRGQDVSLPPVMRAFMYMPLEHSERLEDQELSVECFEQLAAANSGPLGEFLESFARSAREHRDIVRRFGRFPHRNKVLGRKPKAGEEEYLAKGKRFGQ